MIPGVSSLLTTLLDIIRLKKGPDAIPRASILLFATVAMWLFAEFAGVLLIPEMRSQDFASTLLIGLTGIAIYALLVGFYGRQARLLQMITAVVGCTAILKILFLVCRVLLMPALGPGPAVVLIWLLVLWALVVDGHILGRTLDQPLFFGVLIAVAVFFLQYYLGVSLAPAESASP